MRLKTELWVKAYIRRCAVAGVAALVVRHGDDDAGAIFIRINRLNGHSQLFGPAPAGLESGALDRQWVTCFVSDEGADAAVDAYLQREAEFDRDLWVVEVEDRAGRHYLEGWLAEETKN
jgi:hypothetical protein